MSQFIIPSWNLRHQRQDHVDGGERSRSFHVQNQHNPSYVVPMSTDREVTEIAWENGQISMHGLSSTIPPPVPTKATSPSPCAGPADHTLESIVYRATCHHKHNPMNMNMMPSQKTHEPNISNTAAARAGQVQMLPPPDTVIKRARSETESDQCGRYLSSSRRMHDLVTERSACAASATFFRDNNKDTTPMTWVSFESPESFKTKTTDDDSTSHPDPENGDEEQETTKGGGSVTTCSARRSRAAAIHNQSERRRRDRINQKIKALQKLVPNANKTDKASMLDEVIGYLKQLQAQVHMMMMSTRTIIAPHQMMMMMNPLAMQQQLQMHLLAKMGMSAGVGVGMGLGMLDVNAMARTTTAAAAPPHSLQTLMNPSPLPSATPAAYFPPSLVVPAAMIPAASAADATTTATDAVAAASNPFSPYSAFQQTKENMEFYGKMAALYRQHQANQARTNAIIDSANLQ